MPRTLLVTDDASIIREMIKETVTDAGWLIVGEAADGRNAVEQYAALRPDAVTLDLVMPEYDGLFALRGIAALDPAAKVLVVSALDQKAVLREAFKAGAGDFLVKPFDRRLLVEALEHLVPAAAPGSH